MNEQEQEVAKVLLTRLKVTAKNDSLAALRLAKAYAAFQEGVNNRTNAETYPPMPVIRRSNID